MSTLEVNEHVLDFMFMRVLEIYNLKKSQIYDERTFDGRSKELLDTIKDDIPDISQADLDNFELLRDVYLLKKERKIFDDTHWF